MDDLTQIRVSCSNTKELLASNNEIVQRLGGNLGKEFSNAVAQYLAADFHNAYRHLDGRSVADILAEANTSEKGLSGRIVAEGDRDGTHYTLYEAPDEPSENNKD